MVGMRYQQPEHIKEARYQFNKYGKLGIVLQLEQNNQGVDGCAIAVYYKSYKLGYIRNKDFSKLLTSRLSYYSYTVTLIYENYWIIESSPLACNPEDGIGTYIGPTASCSPAINTQKEPKMNISSNIRDSFFREVKNVAIDFQTGKFGVVSNDGISVYTDGVVSVNPITEFGIKIPAFAMRIAVTDLKDGDIIINGNEYSFFKGLTDQGYEVVSLNGEVKQVGSVTNLFFGKNSVLAVKNMFSGSSGNMNPMMMALMLGDSKEFDMKTFAMMSMMGGGQVDSNMLMMLTLMGK